MIGRRTGIFAAAGMAALLAAGAGIAAPNQQGKEGAWTIFVDEAGGKTCYIVAKPTAQSPTNLAWEPVVYIMRGAVTGGRNEPSIRAGYTYQDGSSASVSVGSDTFALFTDKDGAWVADVETERRLIEAMKAGATMIVKGTSSRGNLTTDTYSLAGITVGIKKIGELCP